jgi:hypothetical protein
MTITVKPENPTSYDRIVLEFHVSKFCSGEYVKSATESQFTLTWNWLEPEPGDELCALISPPIQHIVEYHIGTVDPGSYEAIYQQGDNLPIVQSFQVTQGVGDPPVYEVDVSIPTLGVPAAIIFAFGLAYVARKFI